MAAITRDFTNELLKLGGNTEKVADMIDSMGAVAAVIRPHPSEALKKIITEKILDYYDKGTAFVESQPGLENFDQNTDLKNSQFAPFVNIYNRLKSETKAAARNPETAFDYYSQVADDDGKLVILMMETSKQVLAIRATASE